jgi:hypothetical protein
MDTRPRHRLLRGRRTSLLAIIAVAAILPPLLPSQAADANATPVNLAPQATITASSVHSEGYKAQNVADGAVPKPMKHGDVGKAWCAKGNQFPGGVSLTFVWPAPVEVAEIVYYGRTAWQWAENWKDYEVRVGPGGERVLKGMLKRGHGPQRIRLARPASTKTITLWFTSSHGGSNPGASEIRIYSASPPDSALGTFLAEAPVPPLRAVPDANVPESAALRAALLSGKLGFTQLVVIKRQAVNPSHVYTYHQEGLRAGGGLYLYTMNGDVGELKELVDSSEGIVLDSNISFDGKTMMFSWKRRLSGTFQIYTINVDGTNLRQVTNHQSNNFNCCWLPDGGIAFLSDRKPAFAYCWTTTTPILYRCAADGSDLVRLSANYLNDFTPSVMDDGQILYSRWEYVDRPAIPIQSLWTISQDGTGLAGYFGNRVLSPATFMEAREIPGTGKVLCVLTSHNGPCRGGIGIIDRAKGSNTQAAITNLTPEIGVGLVDQGSGNSVRGPYESPFPVDDRHFLVTRDGTVLLRDYAGKQQVTILRKEGPLGYYTARPVKGRLRPPLRASTIARDSGPWATLVLQDVYSGLAPHVKRGGIKSLAVVQEMEKSRFADTKRRAFGFQFPVVSCGATYAPKKVWGYAKVEADGSAHFKVPAGLPIYFMALDEHGRAMQRMRSFTHLMPGERQSCIGCHTDRNHASPGNTRRPLAALRPAQELEKPEWGVRGFSFAHTVQPILDRNCVACHRPGKRDGGVDLSGDKTDFFNVAYETLARQGKPGQNPYTKWIPTFNGMEANILQVTPGYWGSPASKLADIVLSGHPDRNGRKRTHLEESDRRTVFAWIDLNVPYYGTATSRHNDLPGCRRLYPKALDAVLRDVAQRRCISCHKQGVPRQPYVRVTGIESNRFLLAPLAGAAGGTQACGKAVFESKSDPDYQAIVKTFDGISDLMATTPRIDMDRNQEPVVGRPGSR